MQDIQSTDTQSLVLILISQFLCMHKTSHTPSVCPSLARITSRSKSITSSKFLGIKECLNTCNKTYTHQNFVKIQEEGILLNKKCWCLADSHWTLDCFYLLVNFLLLCDVISTSLRGQGHDLLQIEVNVVLCDCGIRHKVKQLFHCQCAHIFLFKELWKSIIVSILIQKFESLYRI